MALFKVDPRARFLLLVPAALVIGILLVVVVFRLGSIEERQVAADEEALDMWMAARAAEREAERKAAPVSITAKSWKVCFTEADFSEKCPQKIGLTTAGIEVYDSARMVLRVPYRHRGRIERMTFEWDRTKPKGKWSQQNPPSGGEFFLKEINRDLFVGSYTEPGEHRGWLPLTLTALKK